MEKEKRTNIFWNLVWFKTNFKKKKSKFSNSFFDFKSKNEFQRVLSFFNFDYETEKWKIKNSQNLFCFEIKKRIILSVHVFIFNAFIRFSFSPKNGKRNTVCFSFFVFMKKLKDKLLKQSRLTLWLLSQVWFIHNLRAGSCQVPWNLKIFFS